MTPVELILYGIGAFVVSALVVTFNMLRMMKGHSNSISTASILTHVIAGITLWAGGLSVIAGLIWWLVDTYAA